jgi:hypothetical protein
MSCIASLNKKSFLPPAAPHSSSGAGTVGQIVDTILLHPKKPKDTKETSGRRIRAILK